MAVFSGFNLTAAWACSPSFLMISGADNYTVYDRKIDRILSEDGYIALVKTSTISEYEYNVLSRIGEDDKVATFRDLKITLTEILYGEPGNIEGSYRAKHTPKFSPKERAAEQLYINTPRVFDFWDTLDITDPYVSWHGMHSSCGFLENAALDTDTYYLVFSGARMRPVFEAVSGPSDPLVKDFRAIAKNAPFSKLSRLPRDFFKFFDAYLDVEITVCPEASPRETDYFALKDVPAKDMFKLRGAHGVSLSDIRPINFAAQFTFVRGGEGFTCRAGDRYLVLDRQVPSNPRHPRAPYYMPKPRHRFVKVENGHIDTEQIKSNINIVGEAPIPLSRVKTWIEKTHK